MERLRAGLREAAEKISRSIRGKATLGLGSGSTVAMLLEELSPLIAAKGVSVSGVPTSTQIELVATRSGIPTVPFGGSVDLVIDGADQVDSELNLIKGGGGALLREKVLMSSARKIIIVAAEKKFSLRLCSNGVKVPVEVVPFARRTVKERLSRLGGRAGERMLPKGFPYFTENGNVILDTGFEPLNDPTRLETRVKTLPGVIEVGIFTIKPITIYRIKEDGGFDVLE